MPKTKLDASELDQRYLGAQRLLAPNIYGSLVFGHTILPNWLPDGNRFWFRKVTQSGSEFLLVDPENATVALIMDQGRAAKALAEVTGRPVEPHSLPIRGITLTPDGVELALSESTIHLDLASYKARSVEVSSKPLRGEVPSPDGRWAAFIRDENLWLRQTDTNMISQVTTDGAENWAYAVPPDFLKPGPVADTEANAPPLVSWSPDSSMFFTHRTDQRNVSQLSTAQWITHDRRPKIVNWRYPFPGDGELPTLEFLAVEVPSRSTVWIDLPPIQASYILSPIFSGRTFWSQDSKTVFVILFERGDRSLKLVRVDPTTGQTKELISEDSNTFVVDAPGLGETPPSRPLTKSDEFLWWSERSGFGHLYLYDASTGTLKNQITGGDWLVREVVHVDESSRQVFFLASGKEDGDPYARKLYRVSFDGGDPLLVTPETGDHSITVSPSGKCFIDTYSTMATPPHSVVRDQEGDIRVDLGEADVSRLLEDGWTWPERFSVTASDGIHEIWGTIFRPSDFDPSKKYPVVDDTYPGVQITRSHAGWADRKLALADAPAFAELGFIVVVIDARGGPLRSKAFRDIGHAQSRDYWLEDHVGAIKHLGATYEHFDLDRVGIYGHSLGGWAAARALMLEPTFFKVGVASGAAHDHRALWYGIAERHHGLNISHYETISNDELADRLEGKLLLIQGGLDHNVGIHVSMQFIDSLIKANKDFDLIVLPSATHNYAGDDEAYATRRRWDYFVRHLLGSEPPPRFKLPTQPLRGRPRP